MIKLFYLFAIILIANFFVNAENNNIFTIFTNELIKQINDSIISSSEFSNKYQNISMTNIDYSRYNDHQCKQDLYATLNGIRNSEPWALQSRYKIIFCCLICLIHI